MYACLEGLEPLSISFILGLQPSETRSFFVESKQGLSTSQRVVWMDSDLDKTHRVGYDGCLCVLLL